MTSTEDELRAYYRRLPDVTDAEQRLLHSPIFAPPASRNRTRVTHLATAALAALMIVALAVGVVALRGGHRRPHQLPTVNSPTVNSPAVNSPAVTSVGGITVHHPRSWRFIAAADHSYPAGVPETIGYLTNAPTRPQCTRPTRTSMECKPPVAHLDDHSVYVILSVADPFPKVRHRSNSTIDGHPATITTSKGVRLCPNGATESITAAIYPSMSETYDLVVCLATPTAQQRHNAAEMISTLHIAPGTH